MAEGLRQIWVAGEVIRVSDIQKIVADAYCIPVESMKQPSGRSFGSNAYPFSHPRQVAMVLAKELTNHSLSRIGQFFGNRDHSTVIHAIRSVDDRTSRNESAANKVDEIRNKIKSSSISLLSTAYAPFCCEQEAA
jgi:chromosomal replication initiator protein